MKENLFTKRGESYKKEAFSFCEEYKNFISNAKTERLCVNYFEEKAKKNGFSNIEGKNFLHVADLLNQSASFTRAWIPAIETLGSKILWSIFVIDRMDGGTQVLTDCGVEVLSLLKINDELFVKALELGIINEKQLQMLRDFKKDQMGSMKQFLIDHPEFLEESLNSDNSKTAKRAKLLVEQDLYGLNK